MVTSKNSPKRRRSIAVTNQNRPAAASKPRRRAHSIAPGAALSPSSKVRRSLAPRKSILKAAVNTLNVETSSQDSTSQTQAYDDTNATRSMDITQDFTALVHDHTSRKSLGRRVSFASHSHVRMFDTNHTNSTGSPQSSRGSTPSSSPEVPAQVHDENDYPGHGSNRRRSSVYSLAQSEDMDLTTVIPSTFQTRGSAILDEDLDDDEDEDFDDDNMDVTEVIRGNLARKRSLSMGVRQPLSQIELAVPRSEAGGGGSWSESGNESMQSDAASEQSQAMEFTIPLGQSLRPPPEQDEAWLALKSITHSGNAPSEPETSFDHGEVQDHGSGMNLDDAMERLRRARDSMSLNNPPPAEPQFQDDSFTSTEDSFGNDNLDDGNKTLNLSRILGRASTGNGAMARMSMGQGSNMDESEVYGSIVPALATQTPHSSVLPTPEDTEPEMAQLPSKPSVFHPPPSSTRLTMATTTAAKTPISGPISFITRVSPSKAGALDTPSKVKPKATFSAAFAPPVARPSPKKPPSRPSNLQLPAKRLRSENDDNGNRDADRPSPAKRQALVGKWVGEVGTATEEPAAVLSNIHRPKPLSPSKKVPFQAAAASDSQPPLALRRPSGYFAKRKSLAASFANTTTHDEPWENSTTTSGLPRKQVGIGLGRASLGSGPLDARTKFNNDSSAGASDKTSFVASEREKDVACTREAARQAIAVPSPTRGSPAPSRQVVDVSLVENNRPHSPSPRTLADEIDAPAGDDEISGEIDIDMEATKNWRQGVEQSEADDDDMPVISIAQFFSITGIKFMDELTAPRRSMHPSQQPIRQARNSSEIPLAEYVTAMAIDVPQLDLYSMVSRDLEAWMEKSKDVFSEAEDEASKVTPELFVEYAKADEEGQAELLHQLNLIRTHTRYLAKSDWYDWKLKWVGGLRATADTAFQSLENDARSLEELKTSADALIPELEQEYEQLRLELEAEQAEVQEIEASDQDYLNELKATIAEQNIVVEALEAELIEGKDQLRWLSEKKEELVAQKREVKNAITNAERILHMKQSSTRSEVFRLKDELEALQDLHMFRITKVNSTLFEYTYASRFHVCIPCRNFLPTVSKVNISRLQKSTSKYKDHFPQLSAILLSSANRLIADGDDDLTVRQIVHRLNDYWSSCAQLRTQLTMLNIKYPVEIIAPTSHTPIFKAKAMVMLPKVLGKIYVSFVFSFNTFSQWPIAIDSLDCEVEVAYGDVDRSTIVKAVMSRLSEASPADNYACLLDACIEVQGLYHQ